MQAASRFFLGLYLSTFILGCNGRGDAPAARVTVIATDTYGKKITLSQKQANWFLKEIAGLGRRSEISKYPAAPWATFEYGGIEYLMHGNAVIHVDENGTEYLWTSPYLQALISNSAGDIFSAIEAVEKMRDLSGVKMDLPGAYPGGGPAPLVNEQ